MLDSTSLILRRLKFVLAGLLLAASLGSQIVRAQNVNGGEIRGTVTDASGAVMPGVIVSIRNTDTGVAHQYTTNAAGIYNAQGLTPGPYSITFTQEGFNSLLREGINLRVQILTLDAQLKVGAVTEQIEVTADAPLLQTEKSEQSYTLDTDLVAKLPTVGRTWSNFTMMLPGVTAGTGSNGGTAVSVNGGQRYNSNWLADGGNVVLARSNNLDSETNLEAIAEVKVSTSTFDAQYGSGTAVFNQITKSGSNQWHGSAYNYLRDDALNARSFFSGSKAALHRNQYGASIGGPIVRNKAFFFFNWDATSSNSAGSGFRTRPTVAMKAGDFSDSVFPDVYDPTSLVTVDGVSSRTKFVNNQIPISKLDPVSLNIQEYYPDPNLPGYVNNQSYATVRPNNPNTFLTKVDYNITDSNRLAVSNQIRRSFRAADSRSSEVYPLNATESISNGLQSQVTDIWTISPTMVNEFRVSMIRQYIDNRIVTEGMGLPAALGINYALADVFPNISIGGSFAPSGIGSGTSAVLGANSYAMSDSVTVVKGRHIVKIGGQFEANQDNGGNWGDTRSADLSFDPRFTAPSPNVPGGLGYADFLTGQLSSWHAEVSPILGLRMKTGQMFVQDDFKLRPNLTLNLGVRYEIQGGWSEVSDRVGTFDPELHNPAADALGGMWWGGDYGRNSLQMVKHTVLPRLGFAYSPNQRWSVRGGFGMFSHRWGTDRYAAQAIRVASFYTHGTLRDTERISPVFVVSDPNPDLNLFIPGPDKRVPDALNGQNTFSFLWDTPVSRVYQWNFHIQRQLGRGSVFEIGYVGNVGTNLSWARDMNQVPKDLLGGPGTDQSRRPYPHFQNVNTDRFDNRSTYHGLQTSFTSRPTSSLSFNVNYTWSKNLAYQDSSGWSAGPTPWQSAYDREANFGRTNNDVPHMFKSYMTYEMGTISSNKFIDAVLGGWQSSFILLLNSGTPFTPIMNGTNLSGAISGSWYPNRIADGTLDNPTIDRWFDTGAFVQPAPFTFGNSGRNILRGPASQSFDFSLAKSFALSAIREGMQIQLRMDADNVLNHPIFSVPNSQIGNNNAGRITSTVGGGREIQMGLRLQF